MGLDVSHDAYAGTYSSFHHLRLAVRDAADVTRRYDYDGLELFLSHSDCDGNFSPAECAKVAESLRALLPAVDPYWQPRVLQFIHGAEKAASRDEFLEFS